MILLRAINSVLGECIKLLSDFVSPGNTLDPSKTIPYSEVVDYIDTYLENIDLTVDKIKVLLNN